MRRAANAYDPDEIMQEQRGEELKERLNKAGERRDLDALQSRNLSRTLD